MTIWVSLDWGGCHWGRIAEQKRYVNLSNGIDSTAAFVFGNFTHSRSNLIQSSIIPDIVSSSVLTLSTIYARMFFVTRMRSSRFAFWWTFRLSVLSQSEQFLRIRRFACSTGLAGDSGRVDPSVAPAEASLLSRITPSSVSTSTWSSFSSTGLPPPLTPAPSQVYRRFLHFAIPLRLLLPALVAIATGLRLLLAVLYVYALSYVEAWSLRLSI